MAKRLFSLLFICACVALVCGDVMPFCYVWDRFDDTHSSNGVHNSAGDASIDDCISLCNITSGCVALDYTVSAAATIRCYLFTTLKKISQLLETHQIRPLGPYCPLPTYVETYVCNIYKIPRYRGLVSYSSLNESSYMDCRDQCLADLSNCKGFDYDETTLACNLLNETFYTEIASDDDTVYYVLDECTTRDPDESGFFLHVENLRAMGDVNPGLDFPDCWNKCFFDPLCEGFDWHIDQTCVINDASAVNATSPTSGYYHHTYFETANAVTTTPVVPTGLSNAATENCLQVTQYASQRSFGATAYGAEGNANINECVEVCRLDTTCMAIDFEVKERPFKGIKCYTYYSLPTLRANSANRHQVTDLVRTCPPKSGVLSEAGCSWDIYNDKSGIVTSGIVDGVATDLVTCQTNCAADYACSAVDWNTVTSTCTQYPNIAAKWFHDDTDVNHYVINSCP